MVFSFLLTIDSITKMSSASKWYWIMPSPPPDEQNKANRMLLFFQWRKKTMRNKNKLCDTIETKSMPSFNQRRRSMSVEKWQSREIKAGILKTSEIRCESQMSFIVIAVHVPCIALHWNGSTSVAIHRFANGNHIANRESQQFSTAFSMEISIPIDLNNTPHILCYLHLYSVHGRWFEIAQLTDKYRTSDALIYHVNMN